MGPGRGGGGRFRGGKKPPRYSNQMAAGNMPMGNNFPISQVGALTITGMVSI